jgi:hypothetical protein
VYEAMLEKTELLLDVLTAEKQVRSGQGVEHDAALQQVLDSLGA